MVVKKNRSDADVEYRRVYLKRKQIAAQIRVLRKIELPLETTVQVAINSLMSQLVDLGGV